MISKFSICRDDAWYLAWPDVALTADHRLVCIFSECTHHRDRSRTRLVVAHSDDRGRTWSPRRALTPLLVRDPARGDQDPFWNTGRLSLLSDGQLVAIGDRIAGECEGSNEDGEQSNWLWFSRDGLEWAGPQPTPVRGIVPDRVIELRNGLYRGRLLLSAHTILPGPEPRVWTQRLWWSDDRGKSWTGPITVAASSELRFCEGSLLELPDGKLVCFLRENSHRGLDAYKTISCDGGLTWSAPAPMPIPACHRPVAGMLDSGRVMITYRFMQGGGGWLGWWTQNTFAALTDVESCLDEERNGRCRILPIDYDRSPLADGGYTGWVQFPDGEIYIVNYIVDDAPKAQIRGYSLHESDFVLPSSKS